MHENTEGANVNSYIKALAGSDKDACAAAVEALVEIGEPAVRPLIQLVSTMAPYGMDKDASNALVGIGAPAVEPLIAALSDKLDSTRRSAVLLLERIGDARAIGPLTAALEDANPGVASAAEKALDTLGWQPNGPDAEARYWAAKYQGPGSEAFEALSKLEWQPDESEAGATYCVVKRDWEKCAQIGVPAVRPLFVALQDADEGVREAASRTLVQIGEAAVGPLISLLDKYYTWSYSDASSLTLRVNAANVLGQIGDPRAIKTLIKMGSKVEQTSEHRRAAAEALAMIGEPAVETLVECLQDKASVTQQLAIWALGKIGDEQTIGSLISMLSTHPFHERHVRQAAREALTLITGEDLGKDVADWEAVHDEPA